MDLTEEQLRRLATLLDEALDLPEDARSGWLDALDPSHADLRGAIAAMLAGSSVDTAEFLPALSKLVAMRVQPERAEKGLDAQDSAVLGAKSPMAGGTVGPYRLIRELGRGGMGTVWLAERTDGLVNRPVAIKLPHASAHQPQLIERFGREREILATLAHPNIARLYDVGVADGQPYLAMEYVEGTPLLDYCDAKKLAMRDRIALFLQVLSAVQHAHSRLIVHRDLKPSNMLVTPAGEVRLLDFGIAKLLTDGDAAETELTQVGGRALTPQYASPEQITGQPVGTAADVYSLGVVLYQLMTGVVPYRLKRETRGALEEAILSIDPKPPSQQVDDPVRAAARATLPSRLHRTLEGDLDTIVLKALKKQPAERYATAEAFAQDLQRYLTGRPVLARPDSPWYRTRKFILRNRLLVGAAATVAFATLLLVLTATAATVVALSIGLAVALWQAWRARENARTAESEARRAQTETRTAQAVQAFLQDIFRTNSSAQADPVKARQTTARDLLDIGSQRIQTALDDVPEAKLEVLATLAGMYRDLSETEQELALQSQRATLARSTYDRNDPRLADALIDYAMALQHRPEALSLLEEAQSILERRQAPEPATFGRLFNALAVLYSRRDVAKAVEFAEKAVRALREGPVSMDFLRALFQLGRVHMLRAEYDHGERFLLEASGVADSLRPQSNILLPHVYELLGICQEASQKFALAERSFTESANTATTFYGESDLRALVAELRLAGLLCRTCPAEGVSRLESARQRAMKLPYVDPWRGLSLLKGSIRPLADFGRIEDAHALARQLVDHYRSNLDRSWSLAVGLDMLAATAVERGRYDEADVSLREAWLIHEELQTNDELRVDHYAAVARLGLVTNRLDEAAGALSALAVPEPDSARIPPGWLEATMTRGMIMLARRNPVQASAHAALVRATITEHALREYFILWETRAAALEGRAQLAAGRAADALRSLERALELAASAYDAELSPALADVCVALGDCFADLQRFQESRASLQRAKAIHERHDLLGSHYREPLRALETRLATAPATEPTARAVSSPGMA